MKAIKRAAYGILIMVVMFVLMTGTALAWETKAVRLSIVSRGEGLLLDQGHAFLAIENRDVGALDIGNYKLEKGEMMTIGLWPSYPMTGSGPFFNVGGAYINIELRSKAGYTDCGIYSIDITPGQLNKVLEYYRQNSYYDYDVTGDLNVGGLYDAMAHNCCTIAMEAWNLVASDADKFDQTAIDAPVNLKEEIIKRTGAQKAFTSNSSADPTDICYIDKSSGMLVPVVINTPVISSSNVEDYKTISVSWSSVQKQKFSNITGYEISYREDSSSAKEQIVKAAKS